MASTGLGIVASIAFLMSVFSPLIAGALYETFGFAAAVYYIGALFVAAGVVFVALPAVADPIGIQRGLTPPVPAPRAKPHPD